MSRWVAHPCVCGSSTKTRLATISWWPLLRMADLQLMWVLWAVLFGAIALYVMTVLSSILVNRRVLKSPFNCYLVFLMIPDLTYTGSCSIGCFLNYAAGYYYSPTACRMQSMYLIWGAGANTWINAVVAYEVRKLLRSSYIRKHYIPPTRKRVVLKSLIVYVYVAFVAFCGLGFDWMAWLPHTTLSLSGLACIPVEYNLASSLFFWLVFVPAFMGIPIVYVGFVIWDVLYHKLLPPRGRRRMLATYFFRIVVAFFIMWLPTVIFFYGFSNFNPWVVWASGVWAHLQGFVSTTVSLMKPDIAQAARQFVTCRICGDMPTDDEERSERSGRSFRDALWSRLYGKQRSSQTSSQNSIHAHSRGLGVETGIPVSSNGESGDQYDDTAFQQCELSFQFLDESPPDPSSMTENSMTDT